MFDADLLITQLLEAVEVGDDGVWLERKPTPKGTRSEHHFTIHHPKRGTIGIMSGDHDPESGTFKIHYISADGSDGPVSRTAVRSGLRSLRGMFPGLRTIEGNNRITGTHALAGLRTGDDSLTNTKINIRGSH